MKIRVHQDISRYIKIYYCKFHPHICCWYPPNLALQPSPWHLVVGRAAQGLGDGLAISPSGANILSSHHLHWGLRQIVKSSCPCSWMSNFICNQINGFPWSLWSYAGPSSGLIFIGSSLWDCSTEDHEAWKCSQKATFTISLTCSLTNSFSPSSSMLACEARCGFQISEVDILLMTHPLSRFSSNCRIQPAKVDEFSAPEFEVFLSSSP